MARTNRLQLLILLIIGFSVSSAEQRRSSSSSSLGPDEAQLVTSEVDRNYSGLIHYFSWADYAVLTTMLVISCGIGLFYGFLTKKQETSDDFLLGGSSMGTVPMAMSLAASFITAIELLGNPTEMYGQVR